MPAEVVPPLLPEAKRASPKRASLGFGIGLRPTHYAELLAHGACGVEWFEAISENFFELAGRPWAVLQRVRRDVPVALHGVGLGIGSTHGPSDDYLSRWQRLIERVEPALVSDHICWGSADGHFTHDLLPLPHTPEMLEVVIERIQRVQDRLRRSLVFENITAYLRFRENAMPEHEFLNAITRRTGASILLDVNNVYVNAQNLGLDAMGFILGLDAGSVAQIHLAGHSRYPEFILDSHVGPVPEPVWALYRVALARFGPVPTLIEWDEAVPELPIVVAEAARARREAEVRA